MQPITYNNVSILSDNDDVFAINTSIIEEVSLDNPIEELDKEDNRSAETEGSTQELMF